MNILDIPEDKSANILIYGNRRTGKTTLIKSLLGGKFKNSEKAFFSPTLHEFMGRINQCYFHTEFSQDLIEKLVFRQQQIAQKFPIKGFPMLMVSDECIQSQANHFSNLKFLLKNSKNLNINLILSSQVPFRLNTSQRANIDYLILLKSTNKHILKNIYHDFNLKRNAGERDMTFNDFYINLDKKTKKIGDYWILDVSYEGKKLRAATKIANWWQIILAKRRLSRLKIGYELKYLPNIGIEYQKANKNFYYWANKQ